MNVIAVQLEHTIGNCVITTWWHDPDNLAEVPMSNYTITILNDTTVIHANNVQSVVEVVNTTNQLTGTFLNTVSVHVPYCGRYLVTPQAVSICGCESPSVTITLNLTEDSCLIGQDSVCVGEIKVPDSTAMIDHLKITTANNSHSNTADKTQGK